MRAALLHEYGAEPAVEELPEPQSDSGVIVEVAAAGMNPVELTIASGRFYGVRPQLPYVVGREGVGRTADGTRVAFGACIPPYGSFAERALVGPDALMPLADTVPDDIAVALLTSGLAAFIPLDRMARMRKGDRVLVLGASGVVGQLAVQLARLLGAGTVIAAARSAAGRERAIELGADVVLGLDELPDAGPSDVVIDLLWGSPASAALAALAPGARVVQVGNAAGSEIVLAAATLRSRNASLVGYMNALVPPPERADAYLRLIDLASEGRLRIEIEKVPLSDVARAWSLQREGPHRKIVVVPRPKVP